jgi:hypothetical protein
MTVIFFVGYLQRCAYPDYVASNGRGRLMNWKGFGRRRSWSEVLSRRLTVGMRETKTRYRLNRQCHGRDLNPTPNTSLEHYRYTSLFDMPVSLICTVFRDVTPFSLVDRYHCYYSIFNIDHLKCKESYHHATPGSKF